MSPESTLISLFVIATAVAILARRLRIPYTVALVIAGLGIGALGVVEPPRLTRELLFAFILPGLLFEASFQMEFTIFRENWRTITALAAPGVVVAIGLTGAICTLAIHLLRLEPGFTLTIGLVFGALIAATDPIAVVAVFRSMRASPRLTTILEAESLLNDGTSIVFLTLILGYVAGTTTGAEALAMQFVVMVGGGILTGLVLGLVVSRMMRRLDDPMVEITLTVIAAYGSFVLAEQFHVSGVLSTVAAGMACGSYGRRVSMSPRTQTAVLAFWEYSAFALNSIVFLMVGFTVPLGSLLATWPEVLVAYLAMLFGRAGVVSAVTLLFRWHREAIPGRWRIVLTWGGLRGALSVVLALGLAPDFPYRSQLQSMTLGVVLASLIIQGLTMGWLLRRTGLVGASPEPG
ncbi:MAG TPA: cation:proton antiporter [Gemmatimonadales bacterium]|jgi:CPA1 family monovalent cation:H+ antiporter